MRTLNVKNGDRISVFKVTADKCSAFGNLNPKPWRTIAVPESAALYRLAEAINEAFDFLFDHPFGFYDNFKDPYHSKTGFELFADIGEESDYPGVKRTKIPAAFPDIGARLLFFFDYGDEWFFPVELIEFRKPIPGKKYPYILEKSGESPEQYPSMEEDGEEPILIELKIKERDLILDETFADDDLTERLKTAKEDDGKIAALYTPDELEDLMGFIAAEANHAKDKKLEKELDCLYGKLEEALDGNMD